MANYMDINKIKELYNNRHYSCDMQVPFKVSENHVFDEDLSVKKNREMVKEHNQKVDDARREYQAKVCELNQKLQDDVIAYISNAYNMTSQQARIIEAYVYANRHSYMDEYFDGIDEISELVEKVLDAQ